MKYLQSRKHYNTLLDCKSDSLLSRNTVCSEVRVHQTWIRFTFVPWDASHSGATQSLLYSITEVLARCQTSKQQLKDKITQMDV